MVNSSINVLEPHTLLQTDTIDRRNGGTFKLIPQQTKVLAGVVDQKSDLKDQIKDLKQELIDE
jgi:hypothetical protein